MAIPLWGTIKTIGTIVYRGIKNNSEIEVAKAGVEVAKVQAKHNEKMAHIERARILNAPGSRIKETLQFIIVSFCMLLVLDQYFMLRSIMSDDLVKWFLTWAAGIIATLFGLKGYEAYKMPETLRAHGEMVHKKAEAEKLLSAAKADDAKALEALDGKRLSPSFLWVDVFKSRRADDAKPKIINLPVDTKEDPDNKRKVFAALEILANNVIEPILGKLRDAWDNPDLKFLITSGYRSPALNALVGGAATSQHKKGEAIDFCLRDSKPGHDLLAAWELIKANHKEWGVPIDQCIYERRKNSTVEWIHISSRLPGRGKNRGQFFKKMPG